MTPIREAVLAAVTARLVAEIPDVEVRRARRAPPGDDEFPLLIVEGGNMGSSDEEAVGETTYVIGVAVTGYARAPGAAEDQDLAAEQALSELHARVVKALAGWQPDGTDLNQVAEDGGADFTLYDLEESDIAAGEFTAGFVATSIRPTGHPYAA